MPDQAVFAILSNASAGTPLPVNFVSFTAQASGNNMDLRWVVGDNDQASRYAINHSTDGVHFTSIGETMYNNIVSATIAAGDFSVTVLNNPAAGNTDVQLQINSTIPGTALIELWTTGGERVSLQQQAIGKGAIL